MCLVLRPCPDRSGGGYSDLDRDTNYPSQRFKLD